MRSPTLGESVVVLLSQKSHVTCLSVTSSISQPPAIDAAMHVHVHVVPWPPVSREAVVADIVVPTLVTVEAGSELPEMSAELVNTLETLSEIEWCALFGRCSVEPNWIYIYMGIEWRKTALKRLTLKHIKNSSDYSTAQQCQWIRDLHEEGIEPHPGPPMTRRILCKNLDGGISTPAEFEKFLSGILREHKQSPLAAVCVQEHNLAKSKMSWYLRRAGDRKILFLAKHAPSGLQPPRSSAQRHGDGDSHSLRGD